MQRFIGKELHQTLISGWFENGTFIQFNVENAEDYPYLNFHEVSFKSKQAE